MISAKLEREFRQGNHAQKYLRERTARRVAGRLGGTGEMLVGRNEVDMTQHVNAAYHRRLDAKFAKMQREMKVMGQHRDRGRLTDRDGGGEHTVQIHPVSYHYWGQRLGYECWDDPQFIREYKRDNDYARVQSHSRNPTFGWRAGQNAAAAYLRRSGKVQIKE